MILHSHCRQRMYILSQSLPPLPIPQLYVLGAATGSHAAIFDLVLSFSTLALFSQTLTTPRQSLSHPFTPRGSSSLSCQMRLYLTEGRRGVRRRRGGLDVRGLVFAWSFACDGCATGTTIARRVVMELEARRHVHDCSGRRIM